MDTSLVITTKDHLTDETQTKTITNINPQAASADLKTFAQMTAALSKDAFVKATRIDKTELDTTKPARTITSFKYSKTVNGAMASLDVPSNGIINIAVSEVRVKCILFTLKTPYDVAPQFRNLSSTSNATVASAEYHFIGYSNDSSAWSLPIATHQDYSSRQDVTAGVVSFTLHFDETDEFAAFDQPITINITEE